MKCYFKYVDNFLYTLDFSQTIHLTYLFLKLKTHIVKLFLLLDEFVKGIDMSVYYNIVKMTRIAQNTIIECITLITNIVYQIVASSLIQFVLGLTVNLNEILPKVLFK